MAEKMFHLATTRWLRICPIVLLVFTLVKLKFELDQLKFFFLTGTRLNMLTSDVGRIPTYVGKLYQFFTTMCQLSFTICRPIS